MKEYALRFDDNRCIACKGCVTACQSWRELPSGMAWREVRRIWSCDDHPTPRLSHVSIGCQHCLKPACLEVCPAHAIAKDPSTGVVHVDTAACVGCRACGEACEYGVPQFDEANIMHKCDLCSPRGLQDGEQPPCAAGCPTNALHYGQLEVKEKQEAEETMLELVRQSRRKLA